MIAWNAVYTYMLAPATDGKLVTLAILIASLCFRRTKLAAFLYQRLKLVSVTKLMIAVLSAAFLLRLFWVLWSPHVPPAAVTEDESIWRLATELAAGLGFRNPSGEFTTWRPVGYPFFLSLLIRLFGPNMLITELVQVLFGVLVVFCIFVLGAQLYSERFGILAAGAFGFYPTAIMSTKLIAGEHLFILLWFIGMIFLISDLHKPSYKKIIVAGLILGVSAIVRMHSIITVGATFITWLVIKGSLRMALGRALLLGILILLCAVPWGVRNYIRLGYPVLYTSLFGKAFYQANNSISDLRHPVNPTMEQGCDPVFCGGRLSEVEWDFAGRRAAWNWIKANPGTFLQKTFGRGVYMLGLTKEDWVVLDNFNTIRQGAKMPPKSLLRFLRRLDANFYSIVFLLSGVGLLILLAQMVSCQNRKDWIYIIAIISFYVVGVSLTLAHRKYRFPIEPFFCLIGIYALYQIFFGYASRQWNRTKINT